MGWIPDVLELLKHRGQVTANELAAVMGQRHGPDAVTRCRQVGLPIVAVGYVPGKGGRRLYTLDAPVLWSALEEAVKELNRHVPLNDTDRRFLRGPGHWIECLKRGGPPEFGRNHVQRQRDRQNKKLV